MLNNLLILTIAGFIAYAVWRMLRPKYAVQIVVNEQGVQRHEGLPTAHQKKVLQFLEQDLQLDGQIVICARRQPGGYVRIDVKGHAHPGTQQQIRNYLKSVL